MKLNKIENCKALILGGGPNGLGIARSLGREGVKSVLLETKKNYSFYSKYVSGIVCPHPKDEKIFIDFLINIGKKLKSKAVIFFTNDHWMIPASKHQEILENYYLFPCSEWSVLNKCCDKIKMYELADQLGISHPKTFYLKGINEVNAVINQIPFPCIIKPSVTTNFAEKLNINSKTIKLNNIEELKYWADKISKSGLENRELVVQEYIPGDIHNLWTITTYSNNNYEIKSYSTGYKLRQRPPNAGTIISGRVVPNPVLLEPTQKLIKNVGFYGIANTEYKYDARDKTFKLIEINPRPGKWNYSVMASGINMPIVAYKDIHSEEQSYIYQVNKELVWLCFLEDFYNTVLGGFKKKKYPGYSLTLVEYFKSIKGKKVDAIFNYKDIMPGIIYFFKP